MANRHLDIAASKKSNIDFQVVKAERFEILTHQ